MGVTDTLARYAVRSAHVLVAEVPGQWPLRMALERQVADRGWRLAGSPADADVLAVCGAPGPEMSAVVERLWDQLPGPRVRLDLAGITGVEAALDDAASRLADTARQRDDARGRPQEPSLCPPDECDRGEVAHGDHEGHGSHGETDHGGRHDHGDHGGMDNAPGGVPLAQGGEDRDGLEMDVLQVRLGPVLPHWPAGLVLRCSLQGDVIVEAAATIVDSHDEPGAAGRHQPGGSPDLVQDERVQHAAARCDNAAALLALAGWHDAATAARRVRDRLVAGADLGPAEGEVTRLLRRLSRSRPLRWSLRGIRPLSAEELEAHGLPEGLAGDTRDRLLAMVGRARAAIAGSVEARDDSARGGSGGGHAFPAPTAPAALEALPRLVRGLDLATARLVVASLDLEPLVPRPEAARA